MSRLEAVARTGAGGHLLELEDPRVAAVQALLRGEVGLASGLRSPARALDGPAEVHDLLVQVVRGGRRGQVDGPAREVGRPSAPPACVLRWNRTVSVSASAPSVSVQRTLPWSFDSRVRSS